MKITNENFIHIPHPNEGDLPFLAFNTLEVHKQLALKEQILENQKIVEKLKQWYKETQEPLLEGHIPIVSLNGVAVKLQEILSQPKVEDKK